MPPRFGATIRLLAVLLLALAVSPLTAPFSTTSPAQLFNQDPTDDGLLGARKGPDEPVAGLAAPGLAPSFARCIPLVAAAASLGEPRGLDALHLPLRI